ncbi:MAG: FkbM family methyltransferase [Pseudomonadales bacterium]
MAIRALRTLARILYPLQGTGLPRIAERIRRGTAARLLANQQPADFWIQDFMGRLQFCCDLRDHMGSQIFFRGAYSFDQLALIRTLLPQPCVFVDIGANQGEFSVFVASLCKDSQVLAFEPTSQMRARLKANVKANEFDNVRVFAVGLSNEAREDVPIYGGHSTFEDGTRHSGLPTIFAISQRDQLLETISLRTLDDVWRTELSFGRIDLMKIDVEGAELHVLQGARQTIAEHRPFIIFESSRESSAAAGYSTSDLYQLLYSWGYELQAIGAGGALAELDSSTSFCNVLGMPREKVSDVNSKLGARELS